LFAQHNTLKDPPFIRNDLIARRNLLIYLDRELQQQLCGVLHYGLKQDGCLFLGSAETAESTPELFRLIDRDVRLYLAKPSAGHAALALPQFAPEHHRAFPPPRLPPAAGRFCRHPCERSLAESRATYCRMPLEQSRASAKLIPKVGPALIVIQGGAPFDACPSQHQSPVRQEPADHSISGPRLWMARKTK
jgi:hypothetical protein